MSDSGQLQPGGVFVFTRLDPLADEQSLRSYLLLRAIGRSVVNSLLGIAIAIAAVAVACWLANLHVLAVLIGLVAVAALLLRLALAGLAHRLGGNPDPRVRQLVVRTGRGLRREFGRVGLPRAPWATLLIGWRLLRRPRRTQTLQALRRIELARVVPSGQVDELHLLLQSARR